MLTCIRMAFVFGCISMALSSCTRYQGTIDYVDNVNYKDQSLTVAPLLPSQIIQKKFEKDGEILEPTWKWDGHQKSLDSLARATWFLLYGAEQTSAPAQYDWNTCLDWKNGEFVPVLTQSRSSNITIDTFPIFMPSMKKGCQNLNTDLLIVPSLTLFYPVKYIVNGKWISLQPEAVTGAGVWHVREEKWLRMVGGTFTMDFFQTKNSNMSLPLFYNHVATNHMPSGKNTRHNLDSLTSLLFNKVEIYGFFGGGSVQFDNFPEMYLENGMEFGMLEGGLGARYFFNRFAIELEWQQVRIRYAKNPPDSVHAYYKIENSLAMINNGFNAGFQYYPFPQVSSGHTNWRFGLGAGFHYEKNSTWNPVNELLADDRSHRTLSDLYGGYTKLSLTIGNKFLLGINVPLIWAWSKDGFVTRQSFQMSVGFGS